MTAIERFGVRLAPITESDIEQLRVWRNLPQIRGQMVFRQEITPEMQRAWFAGLDSERNYYWVIEVAETRIGVAHIKGVDRGANEGEWGIYIVDEDRGGMAAMKTAILVLDFGFDTLGLVRISATVLRSNARAIRMNVALGMVEGPARGEALSFELTREAYARARARFSSILR